MPSRPGDFAQSTAQHSKVALRILAPAGMATAPIAEATGTALQFLADRIGVAYPLDTYTQVFVQGDVQQEAVGMSLLPASYGAKLAKQPDDPWVLAQALAHQWYGVGLPCADWSDYWLSAGMSTFMADAFLEKRFGKARYEKEIERSRGLFEAIQSDGKDRPLSWGDWQTPQQAMGDLLYYKGVVVLDLLRRELGDEVFWRGLHRYTSQNWGKRVTTDNLEAAMDAASGKAKNLTKFFERWVTGCCGTLPPGRGHHVAAWLLKAPGADQLGSSASPTRTALCSLPSHRNRAATPRSAPRRFANLSGSTSKPTRNRSEPHLPRRKPAPAILVFRSFLRPVHNQHLHRAFAG